MLLPLYIRHALLSTIVMASLLSPLVLFANAGLVDGIFFSKSTILEREQITVYAVLQNFSGEIVSGSVVFFDDESEIATVPFTLESGVIQHAQVDYTPLSGMRNISASVITSSTSTVLSSNLLGAKELLVQADTDNDKIPDSEDTDDDNDGVSDIDELANGTDPIVNEQALTDTSATTSINEILANATTLGGSTFEKVDAVAQGIAESLQKHKKELEEKLKIFEAQKNTTGTDTEFANSLSADGSLASSSSAGQGTLGQSSAISSSDSDLTDSTGTASTAGTPLVAKLSTTLQKLKDSSLTHGLGALSAMFKYWPITTISFALLFIANKMRKYGKRAYG